MNIDELFEQQRAALRDGDTAKALKLLDEIQAYIDKKYAWEWLRNNEPTSYDTLIEKLKLARLTLASPGRTEMKQLVQVFKWCEDYGIQLSTLKVSPNLHKYREAVAYLNRMIDSKEPDDVDLAELMDAIDKIKGQSRSQVRAWARQPKT